MSADLLTELIPHGTLVNTLNRHLETARGGYWIAYPARFADRDLVERYQRRSGAGLTEAQARASAACVACATCRTCADPNALPAGVARMPLRTPKDEAKESALVRDGLQIATIWDERDRGVDIKFTDAGYYRWYATLAEAGIAAVKAAEFGWPVEHYDHGGVAERGMDRTRKPLTRKYTGR